MGPWRVHLVILGVGAFCGTGYSWSKASEAEEVAVEKKALEERHAQNIAKLPGMLQDIQNFIAQGAWEKAAGRYEEALEIQPDFPGLAEAWAKIGPQVEQERREAKRKDDLKKAMEKARDVASSQTKCADRVWVGEAAKGFQLLRKGDPELIEATALVSAVEVCRKSIWETTLQKNTYDLAPRRFREGELAEQVMSSYGVYARAVEVSGKNNVVMTITTRQMREAPEKLRNGGFFTQLQKRGFKQIVFGGVLDYTDTYTLSPQSEAEIARADTYEELYPLGLSVPAAIPFEVLRDHLPTCWHDHLRQQPCWVYSRRRRFSQDGSFPTNLHQRLYLRLRQQSPSSRRRRSAAYPISCADYRTLPFVGLHSWHRAHE